MWPRIHAVLGLALLAVACSPSPSETAAVPGTAAAPETRAAPEPAAPLITAPPVDGPVVVEMALVPGLGPVARSPKTLRRKLRTTPPEGFDLSALPDGDWSYGRAPLTKTVGVEFALSADRTELWFDGNRDGRFTPDELRRGGRRFGRVVWHDGLEARTERVVEDETFHEMVFLAVGAQPKALNAFSRLDGHRAGVLVVADTRVRIAVIDQTFRGWYGHAKRDRLMVDTDGDGRFETSEESHERYRLGEPIPVGELDYVAKDFGLFGEKLVFEPSEKKARRPTPLGIGYPAPEITATALDGSDVRLSAHEGSWVLVDFWATWCGPCLRELPHLKKLKAGHPELVVLGVSGDRQRAALESFLQRSPLPWAQVYDDKAPIRRLYRVTSLPTSYLIAPDGTIAAKSLRGAGIENRYLREVERWERAQQAAAAGAASGG